MELMLMAGIPAEKRLRPGLAYRRINERAEADTQG
jgi:hypothetical protein